MIGDNLETDIKFANNIGIDSLLVFTGVTEASKYQRGELDYKGIMPSYIKQDLSL